MKPLLLNLPESVTSSVRGKNPELKGLETQYICYLWHSLIESLLPKDEAGINSMISIGKSLALQ